MVQAQMLARAAPLADILRHAGVEDFTVDNSEGRAITDVARQVLSGAGWLG